MPLSTENRNWIKGMAFLSPWLIGFLVFTLVPICISFYLSFCDYSGLQPPLFRGLENYRHLLSDSVFWLSIRNMLLYMILALPTGLAVALFAAMLLNTKIRGQSFYRTLIFLPSIVPAVASAMVWLWMLNGQLGLFNYFLHSIGIRDTPNWLTDTTWAMRSLALMSVWSVGNTVVIYLAGLQEVPRELYEAAELDGAGPFRKMLHVTLPTISPVIFFNLIMGIIHTLQEFMRPYIMTQGGPQRSTYFYTMFIYDNTFGYLKMGMASALAWIQLLIILALTGLAFWSSRRWVHYQGGE